MQEVAGRVGVRVGACVSQIKLIFSNQTLEMAPWSGWSCLLPPTLHSKNRINLQEKYLSPVFGAWLW